MMMMMIMTVSDIKCEKYCGTRCFIQFRVNETRKMNEWRKARDWVERNHTAEGSAT